ncbi:MAG: hypothetical protein A2Y38_16755 [Spirochaetes bacterium GWB1_59_5]|nr:MAG: hypothetical protein A2Y38_16755 [Spirochaetes bacterium GWB1_59_5]
MSSPPAWLRREIAAGLQALVALGLEGQPAAEVLPLTADIWLRAVSRGNVGCTIEVIDAPRIREAFAELFPTLTTWPPPKHLLERIPPRPQREALAAPVEDDAGGLERLREIQERLKEGFTLPEAVVKAGRYER